MSPRRTGAQRTPPGGGLFVLLKPYRGLVALLVVLTIAGNGLTLVVPKLISRAIDAYTQRAFVLSTVVLQFLVVAFLVFALNYLQNITQTYDSERVARSLRTRLAAKIATQSYSSIEKLTPAKLLTNLASRDIGIGSLRIMAAMIPAITLAVNLATIIILLVGGRLVILGSMTLGDFTAFNSYLALLIFPIIMLGFMSTVMAQAGASYMRLSSVLTAPEAYKSGTLRPTRRGDLTINNISLAFGDKQALKNVSFSVESGTKTTVIGPTAAGKTQLLYVLIGLLQPTSGTVTYDGELLDAYDKEALHRQIGFVFQDSILFNMTLRENIAFSSDIQEEDLEKAIAAAELRDFIASLPQGLDTVVSERGTTLSGGQKQRVMLARALALNPQVLLLDDFTARVDTTTERAILLNIHEQYPGITLISVTQKVGSVEDYPQIVLLMEGEMLAIGTHAELMETSPEYVQIYDSQRSTNVYEVQA